jgi:hypothetical protein
MPDDQAATALDISIELSEFGILANSTDDLDLLLRSACRTVSHALRTDIPLCWQEQVRTYGF